MVTWSLVSTLTNCRDAIVDELRAQFMEHYTIYWPGHNFGTLSLGTLTAFGTVNISAGGGEHANAIQTELEMAYGVGVPVVTNSPIDYYQIKFPTKGEVDDIDTTVVWSGTPDPPDITITRVNQGTVAVVPADVPMLDRLIGTDRTYATPCCFVYPYQGETQEPNAGTNLRDDIVYPFGILFVASVGQASLEVLTEWRQKARRVLHNGRLSGVSSVIRVTVEPMPIVLPDVYRANNWIVSGLVVKCLSREARE